MVSRIKPLVVGLTGNFGTGKSTTAQFFRELGAQVIHTDRLAHEVFKKGNPLYPGIRSLFPELKGSLSRTKIARIVFGDSRKRRALESLIHPYVFDRIGEEIGRRRERAVILEIPLLFESGFDQECDRTVVVLAPERRVFERLLRKGFRRAEVEARWRAQMPLREKIRRADYLIDNSNGREVTRRQVVQIWRKIERSLNQHGKRESRER